MVKHLPLDEVMKEKGVSNYKLAKLTGLPQAGIGRWRKGEVVTSLATAKRLFKALDAEDRIDV